jgi:adenylate kinase family enzyme
MKRVVIFGPGGSGKSTLAVRLGEITGLPVIELDRMFPPRSFMLEAYHRSRMIASFILHDPARNPGEEETVAKW